MLLLSPIVHWVGGVPEDNCSRHSKVISNWYLSMNFAGLFRTLTFSSEIIDMTGWVCCKYCIWEGGGTRAGENLFGFGRDSRILWACQATGYVGAVRLWQEGMRIPSGIMARKGFWWESRCLRAGDTRWGGTVAVWAEEPVVVVGWCCGTVLVVVVVLLFLLLSVWRHVWHC